MLYLNKKQLMTKEEITKELRSIPKYYAGKFEQAYASKTLSSIENGSCKPSTERAFFEKLGYNVVSPVIYEKA